MDKFELEKRTKRFALKIIAFAATLPQSKAGGIVEYQLVKPAPRLVQTTEKLTELNPALTLFTRLRSLRRNLLKVDIGLSSPMMQASETLKNERGYSKSLMSYSQSSQASVEVPRLIALAPKS